MHFPVKDWAPNAIAQVKRPNEENVDAGDLGNLVDLRRDIPVSAWTLSLLSCQCNEMETFLVCMCVCIFGSTGTDIL